MLLRWGCNYFWGGVQRLGITFNIHFTRTVNIIVSLCPHISHSPLLSVSRWLLDEARRWRHLLLLWYHNLLWHHLLLHHRLLLLHVGTKLLLLVIVVAPPIPLVCILWCLHSALLLLLAAPFSLQACRFSAHSPGCTRHDCFV